MVWLSNYFTRQPSEVSGDNSIQDSGFLSSTATSSASASPATSAKSDATNSHNGSNESSPSSLSTKSTEDSNNGSCDTSPSVSGQDVMREKLKKRRESIQRNKELQSRNSVSHNDVSHHHHHHDSVDLPEEAKKYSWTLGGDDEDEEVVDEDGFFTTPPKLVVVTPPKGLIGSVAPDAKISSDQLKQRKRDKYKMSLPDVRRYLTMFYPSLIQYVYRRSVPLKFGIQSTRAPRCQKDAEVLFDTKLCSFFDEHKEIFVVTNQCSVSLSKRVKENISQYAEHFEEGLLNSLRFKITDILSATTSLLQLSVVRREIGVEHQYLMSQKVKTDGALREFVFKHPSDFYLLDDKITSAKNATIKNQVKNHHEMKERLSLSAPLVTSKHLSSTAATADGDNIQRKSTCRRAVSFSASGNRNSQHHDGDGDDNIFDNRSQRSQDITFTPILSSKSASASTSAAVAPKYTSVEVQTDLSISPFASIHFMIH